MTAAASPTPAEEPAAAAPGGSSSLRTRLTGRVRGEREAGAAPAAGSPSTDGGSQGPDTASGQDGTTSPAAPRTDPDDAGAEPSAPARHPGEAAPAAPVTHPAPIQPVRPAKPVAPRPVVRPVEAPDEVAGAPCPSCGTPNPPDRRFCRRCATALNPSAKPEPLPWWRTVWPFRRRVRASSGRAVRLLVILAVVVALCAGALLLLPAGRALFEDTRDKLGKAKPITPVDTKASAQSPRHPAKNTTDGITNSYWGAPAPGASVTYTFRKPFRMVDLIITNGPSKDPEEYHGQARALQIDLEVTTQNGEQQHKQLTLSDKPGPQTFTTGISDVTTVRLVLRSPVGLTSGRQLALAEVEFFQRS
ncbi:zinc-ribbon domain-containing protein [Streptomyces sp. NPDC001663]|uniref:zinc ribbon domain-containing protein n=1 Tax=Streptomyces sp. NPDC001663 TaxID=3364597 RepID=UPI0036A9FF4A